MKRKWLESGSNRRPHDSLRGQSVSFLNKDLYHAKVKTVVYVDAFNLYYGSLKGSDCKWLDLNQLMPLILPKHQIVQIRYFTAKNRHSFEDGRESSDVNLATKLLVDAHSHVADHFVVISNDADLAEPIRVVCHDLDLNVGIINPHSPKERSWALAKVNPTFHWDLRKGVLKASQFPATIISGGVTIQKPTEWA